MNGRALLTLAAVVWLLAPIAPTPPSVGAHAVLVRSVPSSRAAVSLPPDRIQLWFSEPIEPAFSTLTVWNAAGAQVDRKDARVDAQDPKQLSVTLPVLSAGSYTVRARVLSVDGHVVEANFPFTVKPRP